MQNLARGSRNADMLIFGLDAGEMRSSFSVGDLLVIPGFQLEAYLKGYPEDTVGFIVDNATYAQFRPQRKSPQLPFSPMVEDVALLPFRLFKSGWLSAITVAPVAKANGIETRCELDITRPLFGQIWADGHYELTEADIPSIQERYQRLLALPRGYLEMALRRFSRCYKYIQHSEYAGTSELDDYWIDLVIALESITSRKHESIKRNMARRIALLLGGSQEDRQHIMRDVEGIYEQRCSIVHGDEKDEITDVTHEKRFMDAEALRSLVRNTVNACLDLLTDSSTPLVDASGVRKKLPNIIDERFGSSSPRLGR